MYYIGEHELVEMRTKDFTISKKSRKFFINANEVKDGWNQLPLWIKIVSDKTGSVAAFVYTTRIIDAEGRTRAWLYKPTEKCVEFHPQLTNWTVVAEEEI